jgi:outer membrane protein assembly factor BamB
MSTTNKTAHPAQTWIALAWLSGLFCALIAVVLCVGHIRTVTEDPFRSPTLRELKQKLRENPKDDLLKQRIRNLDRSLRADYFRQVWRMDAGVWMLLGGTALFIFSCRQVRRLQREPVILGPAYEPESVLKARTLARYAVAAVGVVFVGGLSVLTLGTTHSLPRSPDQIEGLLAVAQPAVAEITPADYLKNWPKFLGPEGNGSSPSATPPSQWSTLSGSNVAWKVPVPTIGYNSPIIWGEQIFFSGGDAAKREVISLELKSGKLLWRSAVAAPPAAGPASKHEIPESAGYASSTMATDGRHVFAIFASGELAAFNLDGSSAWAKNLGVPDNAYGYANSLTTWKDRLLVQFDQGEADQGKSRLFAFDGATGAVVWEKTRKFGSSWSSPLVFETGGKPRICLLSLPHVVTYAADTGEELWRADVLNGEITPTPIFAGGLILVASPSDKLLALRPGGTGDVTKSNVVWSAEDNVPDVTSPAGNNELVFTMSTSGLLTCFDIKDGKKQWEHDFETDFHASPAVAAGRVYLFSQKGQALVVEAARQFKEVSRTQMEDSFHASPALVGERIVVRGLTNIWCLGPSSAKASAKP